MVRVEGRKIEANPHEVLVGNIAYPRSVDSLVLPNGIDARNYVLNTWDDESFALSGSQKLNGLDFESMARNALGEGQFLARVRDVAPLFRDVNLALRGEGVVYDASGDLIEGERLTQLGKFVNNAWVYLNDGFEKGEGFRGLDVTHLVGMDGDKLVIERQPLEEYAVGCWADVQGEINSQGYFTQKAPVQKFERGKTIYQHKPVANRVVVLSADSSWADLYALGVPQVADPGLGGILCAVGTSQKAEGEKK